MEKDRATMAEGALSPAGLKTTGLDNRYVAVTPMGTHEDETYLKDDAEGSNEGVSEQDKQYRLQYLSKVAKRQGYNIQEGSSKQVHDDERSPVGHGRLKSWGLYQYGKKLGSAGPNRNNKRKKLDPFAESDDDNDEVSEPDGKFSPPNSEAGKIEDEKGTGRSNEAAGQAEGDKNSDAVDFGKKSSGDVIFCVNSYNPGGISPRTRVVRESNPKENTESRSNGMVGTSNVVACNDQLRLQPRTGKGGLDKYAGYYVGIVELLDKNAGMFDETVFQALLNWHGELQKDGVIPMNYSLKGKWSTLSKAFDEDDKVVFCIALEQLLFDLMVTKERTDATEESQKNSLQHQVEARNKFDRAYASLPKEVPLDTADVKNAPVAASFGRNGK